jgi:hypothetical protein
LIIVKDEGSDLNKGIRLISKSSLEVLIRFITYEAEEDSEPSFCLKFELEKGLKLKMLSFIHKIKAKLEDKGLL